MQVKLQLEHSGEKKGMVGNPAFPGWFCLGCKHGDSGLEHLSLGYSGPDQAGLSRSLEHRVRGALGGC